MLTGKERAESHLLRFFLLNILCEISGEESVN